MGIWTVAGNYWGRQREQIETEGERETERERQRDREKERKTDRERDIKRQTALGHDVNQL